MNAIKRLFYILFQVSPANSFGFMDGGIDAAYSRHFGWQMYVDILLLYIATFSVINYLGNILMNSQDINTK